MKKKIIILLKRGLIVRKKSKRDSKRVPKSPKEKAILMKKMEIGYKVSADMRDLLAPKEENVQIILPENPDKRQRQLHKELLQITADYYREQQTPKPVKEVVPDIYKPDLYKMADVEKSESGKYSDMSIDDQEQFVIDLIEGKSCVIEDKEKAALVKRMFPKRDKNNEVMDLSKPHDIEKSLGGPQAAIITDSFNDLNDEDKLALLDKAFPKQQNKSTSEEQTSIEYTGMEQLDDCRTLEPWEIGLKTDQGFLNIMWFG